MEHKNVLGHKLFWGVLLLFGIVLFFIIAYAPSKYVYVVRDKIVFNDYSENSDITHIEIELTFNEKVTMGEITLELYGETHKILSNKKEFFTGSGYVLTTDIYVTGKVIGYKIVEWSDITVPQEPRYICMIICILIDFIILCIFIASLFLSYKIYYYEGKEIIVYAGWYNHYVKIDNEVVDEIRTFIKFTTLRLSTTLNDNTKIDVAISTTNRISLKINDKLYTKIIF